jgi:hypothetical protein
MEWHYEQQLANQDSWRSALCWVLWPHISVCTLYCCLSDLGPPLTGAWVYPSHTSCMSWNPPCVLSKIQNWDQSECDRQTLSKKKWIHSEQNLFMETFRNFTVLAWKIFHVQFNITHNFYLLLTCIKTVIITLIILIYIHEPPCQRSALFNHKTFKIYMYVINSERPCYKLHSYKAWKAKLQFFDWAARISKNYLIH